MLSLLGRDLVFDLLVRERLGVCSPGWGETCCLPFVLGRDWFALRVRERLGLLSVLGRGLRLGGESVLTSPLPVCLSDGGHARPCDPSDLIRCRKYVKSQKARGVQAHQYTQDTGTQWSTMRKLGK